MEPKATGTIAKAVDPKGTSLHFSGSTGKPVCLGKPVSPCHVLILSIWTFLMLEYKTSTQININIGIILVSSGCRKKRTTNWVASTTESEGVRRVGSIWGCEGGCPRLFPGCWWFAGHLWCSLVCRCFTPSLPSSPHDVLPVFFCLYVQVFPYTRTWSYWIATAPCPPPQ